MRRYKNKYFNINLSSNKFALRSSYNINRNAIIINSTFLLITLITISLNLIILFLINILIRKLSTIYNFLRRYVSIF